MSKHEIEESVTYRIRQGSDGECIAALEVVEGQCVQWTCLDPTFHEPHWLQGMQIEDLITLFDRISSLLDLASGVLAPDGDLIDVAQTDDQTIRLCAVMEEMKINKKGDDNENKS